MRTILVLSVLSLSFGLTACGGGSGTGSKSSNHKPLAVAASITTDIEKNSTIILKGTDEDGDTLRYSVVAQPTQGVLAGTAPNLTYKPNKNSKVATDNFTFKVNDGSEDSTVSTIKITLIKNTKGLLIAPLSAQATQKIIINKERGIKFKKTCVDIPKGYQPLKSITIDFLDSTGAVVKNTVTDDCGNFSSIVPNNVVQVRVKSSGNKDLTADIKVFLAQGGSGVASTIPTGSTYEISALQMTTDKTAVFTVTDTLTHNAVIGIPSSALSLTINTVKDAINKLRSVANTPNPASITVLLDASESMATKTIVSDVRDSGGRKYSRLRVATMAAHSFLDNISSNDEAALVIFDDVVNFMDDTTIGNVLSIEDKSGNPSSYEFSKSGFTKDTSKLHFIADAYSFYTPLYELPNRQVPPFDAIHPDTPSNLVLHAYPWLGATAIYDAIKIGVEKTKVRVNDRKVLVLMSDGKDISSSTTKENAIKMAQAASISIHTIAFGSGFSSDSLRDIAKETNGSFSQVNDLSLINTFQSILTGITFQYIANINSATKKGDTVVVTLQYNGETATQNTIR